MLCIIIMRDLLDWPSAMAAKLASEGHEVVLLDNASTYPALLKWYETCPYRVIRLEQNEGHLAPWTHLKDEMANRRYVVTDPDLDISKVPSDWDAMMHIAMGETGHKKVGLSLDTLIPWQSAAPGRVGQKVDFSREIPWVGERLCKLHDFTTDTTFAMSAHGEPHRQVGIRLGRPYTARHMPDYVITKKEPMLPDFRYYLQHANESSTMKKLLVRSGWYDKLID